MDETNQGPKHDLFHLLIQFDRLNFVVENFFLIVLWDQRYGQNNQLLTMLVSFVDHV